MAFEFYVSEQEFKEHLINLDLAVQGAIIRKQAKLQQHNYLGENEMISTDSTNLSNSIKTSNTNGTSSSYESLPKKSSSSASINNNKNDSLSRQGREDSIVFGLGGSTPKFNVNRKISKASQ